MSSDDEFTIRHMWLEHLYYWEGVGQRFMTFKDASDEPLEVHVPAPAQWREWAPEWARERREIILQRLRDRGYCVIESPFLKVLVIPPAPARPERRRDPLISFLQLVSGALGFLLASVSLVKGWESDFWLVMSLVALLCFAGVVCFLEWIGRQGWQPSPPPPPYFRWVRDKDRRDE